MSLLSIFREGSLIVMFKVAIMGEYNVTKLKVELNTAYYQHRAELQYNLKEEFTQFAGKCNKTKRKKHRFFFLLQIGFLSWIMKWILKTLTQYSETKKYFVLVITYLFVVLE